MKLLQNKVAIITGSASGIGNESQEVAELILWLGSDNSSFMTGSYYPVDGGYLAQ